MVSSCVPGGWSTFESTEECADSFGSSGLGNPRTAVEGRRNHCSSLVQEKRSSTYDGSCFPFSLLIPPNCTCLQMLLVGTQKPIEDSYGYVRRPV